MSDVRADQMRSVLKLSQSLFVYALHEYGVLLMCGQRIQYWVLNTTQSG